MIDPFNFNGVKVLVVGGGSGIGKEIAKALCARGAICIISGRRSEKLKEVSEGINAITPGSCDYYCVDVLSEESVTKLFKVISERFDGSLNVLVNSSGTNIRNSIQNVGLKEFKEVTDTNLTGVFLSIKTALPLLLKASFGRVINLASIFSTVSFPERMSYASSKGGVLLLSKTIALEWATKGITVNTISPGPLLTEINKTVLDNKENYDKFCERIPMRRFGEPEEVITAALFLASPMSSYVTGADIVIDGGWTSS